MLTVNRKKKKENCCVRMKRIKPRQNRTENEGGVFKKDNTVITNRIGSKKERKGILHYHIFKFETRRRGESQTCRVN